MQETTDLRTLYALYLEHPEVSTDSRKIRDGVIFFALSGPSFDGNDFALQALSEGAAYAVVSRAELAAQDKRCLFVPDTLAALQELARYHRSQMALPVVAITGTNGKTTTKELTHAVLSRKYRVLSTQGNLNNHIGVPLTLLRLRPEHEVAIIEMGASGPGEIALLSQLAQPTIGLITNIGLAHLQGFGSQAGILDAKSELPTYLLEHGGRYLLNAKDPLLSARWSDKTPYRYGNGEGDVTATLIQAEPTLRLALQGKGERLEVQTQLVGGYNLMNALAAASVGALLGVSLTETKEALESYHPSNNRSQLLSLANGSTLIVDAYNANPSSMQVALEGLSHWNSPHKIAILGEMRELGEASHKEHAQIIRWLEEHPTITPILVGQDFKSATEQAPAYPAFDNVQELSEYLKSHPIPSGSTILLKGSRGVALEQVIPIIQQSAETEIIHG
ncbi:MAG: UDP-N-acetylmuramoyl-tripeptide--D-alanyl-D-alanine ligase [Porphyromonas sp.]|nr:UDP-N-acetylmuramoyl-tripeptide--D-alanyl-D-alanine ligase [Porphyromonas sp.]